ncbi:LuxR family transcriptional regulator [Burkholderia sp. FL-7-2-10-S1-D7]|uniref:response regulator transcription factor n=1 Tax=Burkholderia sp. FL-7-2-10-S1-D7 TaxID=1637866 RepID=UPI00075DFD49|nr:response regulator transcription factor [Burkholderia sp. FL-7-2-10-S1-D7]KVF77996.1 LuxR family transcriptional regulator [Burkholderia sp. FL-7-2-10-S1-D7]
MIANTTFNLLIADDHPLVLTGIEATLRNLRPLRIVGAACNSTEIVELLTLRQCDLLITDFSMPNGKFNDGLTMLTYIRSHYPDLPIIVFTALDSVVMTSKLLKLGVKGIVSKTDDIGHLVSAIYSVRTGYEYLSPSISRPLKSSQSTRKKTDLTKNELEVLRLYVSGMSITKIATQLHRTKQTISAQKIKAMQKLGIERDADLYQMIYESRLDTIGFDTSEIRER